MIAIGREAKNLAGRHTRGTIVTRPMRDGVIHDFETASFMVRSFLGKVFRRFPLSRPKLVVAVPVGITSVEKRAVIEAADMAGAGKVFLIEEPMAAAIGAGLPIDQPSGQMVVDIGGGTTEVAIISKFAVSCSESLRVAGDEANEAICEFVTAATRHGHKRNDGRSDQNENRFGSATQKNPRDKAPGKRPRQRHAQDHHHNRCRYQVGHEGAHTGNN